MSQEVGTEGYVSFCSAGYASSLPVAGTKLPVSIYVSCFLLRPITSIFRSDDQQLTLVFDSKLGGQALVLDVEGTWRELTGVVNKLAANLTSQVCFFLFLLLFGHGFFWRMVFVFSGNDLRTYGRFPSLFLPLLLPNLPLPSLPCCLRFRWLLFLLPFRPMLAPFPSPSSVSSVSPIS